MNYVGSISIIDRGDAPAKAIIDKNTRSLAQRVADETKEELDKVMDRVDNIYVSYEMSTQTMFENPRGSPNVEYIEDIKELEEILTDTVKKKKYQQQVTVFVVGFQDVCSQKMQLLQQVNQFFLDNSKLDEDELTEDKPEIDLEEASNKVNESLSTAEELAKKLSDLNQDIIEWLVNYANTKASNKGKKRLEKSLESAKNELTDLSEKLLKLQTELEEKDEKFQQVAKQLEAKSQEAVRYKTAAEVAKKSAQDNEAHTSVLQDEITRRDEKIVELRTKLSRLEINLTESQFDKEMSTRRLDNAQAQTKLFEIVEDAEKQDVHPEKLAKLQEEVDSQRIAVSDAEREMEKLHKEQLANMHKAHQQEIEELKKEHEEEIAKLTDELLTLQDQVRFAEQQALDATGMSEDLRAKLFELELREPTKDNIDDPISRQSSAILSGKSVGELSASEEEQPSRQIGLYTLSPDESIRPLSSYSCKKGTSDSRQSNKDTKKKSETLKPTKPPSKSPNRIGKDKSGKTSKDFADVSVQDEGGDAAKAYVEKANEAGRQAAKSKNLEPVVEGDGSEFPNSFDLDDEDSWASVPPQHVAGRFLQFRQLGRAKIKELEEQLQVTLTKTHRKVNSLKSQFSEHKNKWEAERKVLIEQVEQAQKLQTDAEKEADAAMTQLEEFINEQEKLEDEEEQKRQEIIKTMSRPGTVKQASPPPAEQKPQEIKPDEQGDRLQTENSEQELKNLMQQTDDAKAQKNARQTGAISAPPAVEPNDSQAQKFENFEEDYESKPVTSREKKTPSNQSHLDLINQKPVSPPKEAFRTPRSLQGGSLHGEVRKDSQNIDADLGEDVALMEADIDEPVEVGKVEEDGQSESIHHVEYLNGQKTVSPPRQASKPPRSGQSRSLHSEMTADSVSIDTYPEEDIAVSKSQSADIENLKLAMAADKLTLEQQKTFESMKSVIKSLSEEQALRDMQLERTVSILSLASQIAQESVEQGVLPDTILDRFSKMGSRGMSRPRSGQRSVKGSALSKIKDKALTDDEDKDKDMEVRSVKQQESKASTQLRSAVSKKSLEMKEKKDKEMIPDKKSGKSKYKVSDEVEEFSFSGSLAADYLSSRGNSFSASLPRTMTSSEWRRFSPHDPLSPNAEKKEKEQKLTKEGTAEEKKENLEQEFKTRSESELSGRELPYEDLQGAETKMSTISVVISPRKKSRPVTMEKMLYGEGSIDVATSGLETSIAIMKDDYTPRSRSTQSSRFPSEKQESYREPVPGEQTSKSSDQSRQSSTSSQMAASFSAKSKRSAQKSEHSSTPEIQQPKSPSTVDRVSPVTFNRTSPITINRSPRTSATPGTMVSDVQRPVSISSVQPKICDSPPPDLHKFHPLQFHKETQTEDMQSQIEHEPVTGNTEEQVRQSSAKSRASLRNQFKSRLDETRQAVEDRRTKSPVIMVPAQKSVDDELIIEDDDDLPIPDDLKEEVFYRDDTLDAGTSPPPGKQDVGRKISMASRKSTNLAEHPVVQEFLRAYTGIHNFKEAMSRVLVDKDQMSASQILSEIDAIPFNKDNKVVPQVSTMTENIYYVLNEVSQVINSVLQNDRGPVVSSLMMGMSRDATQRTILREKSGVTVDAHPETRGSQRTVSTKAGSASTDMAQYQELQAQYEKLQNQMSEESKKYEEQQRHNVVVMMEMQDTINQLQRELSALGKQTRRPTSESVSAAGAQNADSAIMFTRLDSERNAKIMKKAVNEKKLDPNRYKEAMVQMDEYVNLPAQRLTHLVRKYVHHCRMKEIEENVQKSQSLNENVFELFDKMEELQNQRAKRWADRMDEMGIERYRLANMLMETLDSIEQESGLFLIKPMYSYRGREPKEQNYSGKITRPFRPHRTLSPLRDSSSAHAPAPTPASNVRARNQTRRDEMYQSQTPGQGQYEPKGPLEGDTTGLMGSSVGYMAGQSRSTWSMADSQIGMSNPMLGNVNTPRILELDINRMMIGQNTISAQIGSSGLSNDRLVNAANNNLRAYMTVNRPGPNSAGRADRPLSGSRQSPRPSSSPTNPSVSTAKRVRMSDVEIPTVLSSGQPLPPIGTTPDKPRSSSTKGSRSPPRIPVGNELPESPPGSSLRHSPPGMEDSEVTSPVK